MGPPAGCLRNASAFVPGFTVRANPVAHLIVTRRPGQRKIGMGKLCCLDPDSLHQSGAYHFAVLIVAAVLAANYFMEYARRGMALLMLAFYALACLPVHHVWPGPLSAWQTFQAYLRLGALTALWFLLLWALNNQQPEKLRVRLRSREAAAFAALLLALTGAGVWSNFHHLHGLFTNYATRLLARENSTIAIEPAVAGERVFFTTMARSGYTIASLDQGTVANLASVSDAFHLAASESGETFMELASTISRVVRAPLGELPFESASAQRSSHVSANGARDHDERFTVEAEDAEQPLVSRDGKWLAFIRETRGRGSLWIKELLAEPNAPRDGAGEWEAGNDRYDVLEAAFFPDDHIVFAAQFNSSQALFALDPNTHRVSPFPVSSLPCRYPAVSPRRPMAGLQSG